MPLAAGHTQIPLRSSQGTFYIRLAGYDADIDNLNVALIPEPLTSSLLVLGGIGLLGRRRRLVR